MINLNGVKARIKRNKLIDLAGDHFRDEHSEIVQLLKGRGYDALLGIQREDGVYTIIGEKALYYSTATGFEGTIALEDFKAILTRNAMSKGKSAVYEYVKIDESSEVWVKNAYTMNALWNTMLMFL